MTYHSIQDMLSYFVKLLADNPKLDPGRLEYIHGEIERLSKNPAGGGVAAPAGKREESILKA